MGQEGGGQVSAGGGAHDGDASGVDLPIRGAGADEAEGAGGVLQHDGMAVAVRAEAILEDERGEALLHDPFGVVVSFVAGEHAVAAAGTDDDGRAGGVGLRQVGRDGRAVFVFAAEGAGDVVGPEGNGGLGLGQN